MFLIPGVLAIGWWFISTLRLPSWRNAKYVKNPNRAFWGPTAILDRSEWTEEGLALRRRYFMHFLSSCALAVGAILVLKILGHA